MNEHLEFGQVMDDYAKKAEEVGKDSPSAWIYVDDVWWPNPHYTGEPTAHPECASEFHPPKTLDWILKNERKNK